MGLLLPTSAIETFSLLSALRPPPAIESRSMTFEGFLRYMESKDCCVFDQTHTSVYQDMDEPLSSYFISSSHNTYLTGDQLVGKSHLDAYVWYKKKSTICTVLLFLLLLLHVAELKITTPTAREKYPP